MEYIMIRELTKEEKKEVKQVYCDFCGEVITKKQYFESGCVICVNCK